MGRLKLLPRCLFEEPPFPVALHPPRIPLEEPKFLPGLIDEPWGGFRRMGMFPGAEVRPLRLIGPFEDLVLPDVGPGGRRLRSTEERLAWFGWIPEEELRRAIRRHGTRGVADFWVVTIRGEVVITLRLPTEARLDTSLVCDCQVFIRLSGNAQKPPGLVHDGRRRAA